MLKKIKEFLIKNNQKNDNIETLISKGLYKHIGNGQYQITEKGKFVLKEKARQLAIKHKKSFLKSK